MTDFANETLNNLVEQITTESTTTFIKSHLFSDELQGVPRFNWSFANQFTLLLYGTFDARTFNQWKKVGRYVKQGSRAIHILAPLMVNKPEDPNKPQDPKQPKEQMCIGFKTQPVFKIEDTDGKDVEYDVAKYSWDIIKGMQIKGFDLSTLPLHDIAKKLNVKVVPSIMPPGSSVHGLFTQVWGEKIIKLNTNDPIVFLHELSHAIDHELPGHVDNDKEYSEIVAELSASFLASLYNVSFDIISTKAYIQSYTGKQHVFLKVTKAMQRVEEIYKYVVENHVA